MSVKGAPGVHQNRTNSQQSLICVRLKRKTDNLDAHFIFSITHSEFWITCGFPTYGVSNAGLWCLLSCWPGQDVKQIVMLPVIWDAATPIWRCFNVCCSVSKETLIFIFYISMAQCKNITLLKTFPAVSLLRYLIDHVSALLNVILCTIIFTNQFHKQLDIFDYATTCDMPRFVKHHLWEKRQQWFYEPKVMASMRKINRWWRHQMETFPALLVICAGDSPVNRWISRTKASDAKLWCFIWSLPE